jgi:hypothetical protein
MQMALLRRAVTAGLKFSVAPFDSWYFAAKLTRFLESLGKHWISQAKSDRKILVNGEYEESLDLRDMKCYAISGKLYLTKSVVTRIRKVGDVRIVISRGVEGKKFFVTNMITS